MMWNPSIFSPSILVYSKGSQQDWSPHHQSGGESGTHSSQVTSTHTIHTLKSLLIEYTNYNHARISEVDKYIKSLTQLLLVKDKPAQPSCLSQPCTQIMSLQSRLFAKKKVTLTERLPDSPSQETER